MRLIACLSWWNEPLRNLESSIQAAASVGTTHLAALDGAYAALDADPSPPEQADAIRRFCREKGIVCVVDELHNTTEIEKRTELFNLAYRAFQPSRKDWFLILDADTTITWAGTTLRDTGQHVWLPNRDLKPWLSRVRTDACNTMVYEGDADKFSKETRRRIVRFLMRCNPGLRVGPANHYTYRDGKGRVVWGLGQEIPAVDAPIVLHNNSDDRPPDRAAERERYYTLRRSLNLEQHDGNGCDRCDEPGAIRLPTDYEYKTLPDGTVELASDSTAFRCADHAQAVLDKNYRDLHRICKGNEQAMNTLWTAMLEHTQTRSLALPN